MLQNLFYRFRVACVCRGTVFILKETVDVVHREIEKTIEFYRPLVVKEIELITGTSILSIIYINMQQQQHKSIMQPEI